MSKQVIKQDKEDEFAEEENYPTKKPVITEKKEPLDPRFHVVTKSKRKKGSFSRVGR